MRLALYERTVSQVSRALIGPLSAIIPEMVEIVLQDLEWRGSPEIAGSILLREVDHWRTGMQVKIDEADHQLRQAISRMYALENELEGQKRTTSRLTDKFKSMEKENQRYQQDVESLKQTIRNQNVIIYEQHEQLISLMGMEEPLPHKTGD